MPLPFEPLASGELRVFYARTFASATREQTERCRAMLSPEERDRHLRFRFEADQQSYLAAHALTRGVLGRALAQDPSTLRFVAGEHGRPELVWPEVEPRIRFNLSHTRGLVACAVAMQVDVGVDVENVDRRVDIERLATKAFSDAEREALGRLQGDARRQRFFELWTLKEAYIKAVGMGLALPLTAITLHLDAGASPQIAFGPRITDDPSRWSLAVQTLVGGHMLAVAVADRSPLRWSVEELNRIDI